MTSFARGFRLHPRNGAPLDGAEFPSGRVLVLDDPEYGLATAAASIDDLLRGGYHGARIEWAPATCPNPAAHVEVRAPCPHCADHPLIPRRQMAEHQARLHALSEEPAPAVAELYPGRRRAKGGHVVHATRLRVRDGVGHPVAACGKRADASLPEPRSALVTCKACKAAIGQVID